MLLSGFGDVRGLNSGRLDYVPSDLVGKLAAALNAMIERIASMPAVLQYYGKFGANKATVE